MHYFLFGRERRKCIDNDGFRGWLNKFGDFTLFKYCTKRLG
jgi:hypothetical protein